MQPVLTISGSGPKEMVRILQAAETDAGLKISARHLFLLLIERTKKYSDPNSPKRHALHPGDIAY